MGGKELLRAEKLLRRKKFSDVIHILESQVFKYRQNAHFYYLLGTSYFHTGDIAGATTYLKRVLDLQHEHIPSMLQLAAIELQRRENQKAIELWLRVLEIEPKNKFARKGLNLLKNSSHNQMLIEKFISSKNLDSLVPHSIKYFPLIAAGIVIVIFIVPLILVSLNYVTLPVFEKTSRNSEVSNISIAKGEEIVSLQGESIYILTEQEIIDLLEDAKNLFNSYKDNKAQIAINKLKYSNASQSIKNKAVFLETYLKKPDFTNFSDNITYKEIQNDPLLYENCYVRWKGKISNIEITEQNIRFDFLVGYQDNKVLEGIVPVYLDFGVSLEQGNPVELIGKIEDPLRNMKINCSSIRPIAPSADS